MKIADMYHNGYGVDKDEAKYKALLNEIYNQIKDSNQLFIPLPEVSHRLAALYIEEGQFDEIEIINMLLKAKSFIEQRIRYSPFWGNFIVCRRVITLLYKVYPFNYDDFNFFDLFYLFLKPHKIKLFYNGKIHIIESIFDEDAIRVKYNDKYFKSVENFLINALIDNKHIYVIEYEDFYRLELVE